MWLLVITSQSFWISFIENQAMIAWNASRNSVWILFYFLDQVWFSDKWSHRWYHINFLVLQSFFHHSSWSETTNRCYYSIWVFPFDFFSIIKCVTLFKIKSVCMIDKFKFCYIWSDDSCGIATAWNFKHVNFLFRMIDILGSEIWNYSWWQQNLCHNFFWLKMYTSFIEG